MRGGVEDSQGLVFAGLGDILWVGFRVWCLRVGDGVEGVWFRVRSARPISVWQ